MILAKSYPYLRLKPLGLSMNHMVEQLKFVHRTEISLSEIRNTVGTLTAPDLSVSKNGTVVQEILLVK